MSNRANIDHVRLEYQLAAALSGDGATDFVPQEAVDQFEKLLDAPDEAQPPVQSSSEEEGKSVLANLGEIAGNPSLALMELEKLKQAQISVMALTSATKNVTDGVKQLTTTSG